MSIDGIGPAIVGGLLIGLGAATLLVFNGRIAGVSGVFGRLFTAAEKSWRIAFLAGLVLTGLVVARVAPHLFGSPTSGAPLLQLAAAGLLVGVGTQLANGCTSGHGVCGIGRGSLRSIVATVSFMASGALVVAVLRGGL